STLTVFSVDTTSHLLTLLATYQEGDTSNGHAITGLGGARAVTATASAVFVAGSSDNAIAVFRVNTDGSLTFQVSYLNGAANNGTTIAGLAGADALLLDATQGRLYVAG